jgi:hypothetical protein
MHLTLSPLTAEARSIQAWTHLTSLVIHGQPALSSLCFTPDCRILLLPCSTRLGAVGAADGEYRVPRNYVEEAPFCCCCHGRGRQVRRAHMAVALLLFSSSAGWQVPDGIGRMFSFLFKKRMLKSAVLAQEQADR